MAGKEGEPELIKGDQSGDNKREVRGGKKQMSAVEEGHM